MRFSLRSDLEDSFKLKWLKQLSESPANIDWPRLTSDLSKCQPLSVFIFDFETTEHSGQCIWTHGQWYGSITNRPHQKNIPLDASEITHFIQSTSPWFHHHESNDSHRLEPIFEFHRNPKIIVSLLLLFIIASLFFQTSYQVYHPANRQDIPDYTLVANPDATSHLFLGQYFSGHDIDDSYIKISSDKSVTVHLITKTIPLLASDPIESWKITDIGINQNGFVIILDDERTLQVDKTQQSIIYNGNTFERI